MPGQRVGAAAGPLAPSAASAHVAVTASELGEYTIRATSTLVPSLGTPLLVVLRLRRSARGHERWFLGHVDWLGTWATRTVVLSATLAMGVHACGSHRPTRRNASSRAAKRKRYLTSALS